MAAVPLLISQLTSNAQTTISVTLSTSGLTTPQRWKQSHHWAQWAEVSGERPIHEFTHASFVQQTGHDRHRVMSHSVEEDNHNSGHLNIIAGKEVKSKTQTNSHKTLLNLCLGHLSILQVSPKVDWGCWGNRSQMNVMNLLLQVDTETHHPCGFGQLRGVTGPLIPDFMLGTESWIPAAVEKLPGPVINPYPF